MRHAWVAITCLLRPVQAVVQRNVVLVVHKDVTRSEISTVLLQNCILVPSSSMSVCPVPAPGFLNQKIPMLAPLPLSLDLVSLPFLHRLLWRIDNHLHWQSSLTFILLPVLCLALFVGCALFLERSNPIAHIPVYRSLPRLLSRFQFFYDAQRVAHDGYWKVRTLSRVLGPCRSLEFCMLAQGRCVSCVEVDRLDGRCNWTSIEQVT